MKTRFLAAILLSGCAGGTSNSIHDLAMAQNGDDAGGDQSDMTMSMDNGDMAMSMGVVDMIICNAPSKLFPPKNGELYCPFSAPDASYCASMQQHCCEPATGTSECIALSSPCPVGDTDWQCEDPADCAGGQKCCGTGTLQINGNPMCANFATGFKGTHCAASCVQGEIQMCTSNGECSNGQTCQPFRAKGNQVGGCG